MKKYDKEILQTQLGHEKEVIAELKEMYEEAERQIDEKIQMLMADELTQSKIYQIEYQKALQGQIGTILDNMNSNNYDSIQDYLKQSYEDGYIGTMYSLQQQGIPLIIPIDQNAVVKAIQLDSKLSGTLYEAMGTNTNDLKKSIRSEVSRGISNAYSYQDIARNINNTMNIGLNKSIRIARTEGHRVNQESTMDGMQAAKAKGADIVKQWDATLDAKTRPSHQKVDGEIKELDEKFSNGLRFPGDPHGKAGEVINCRCVLLQRARWALDKEELEQLQMRAAAFGLDKTENFEDFKQKYLSNTRIDETEILLTRGEIKKKAKVNKEILQSSTYRSKFESIDSKAVRKTVIAETKSVIMENDRSIEESYSIIDAITGTRLDYKSKVGAFGGSVDMLKYRTYESIVLTHNHPLSTSFSIDDIQLACNCTNVKSLIAGGHDGTVYSLTIGNGERPKNIEHDYYAMYDECGHDLHETIKALANMYRWNYERK